MKRLILLLCFYVLGGVCLFAANKPSPVMDLFERVCGRNTLPVSVKLKKEKGETYFQYQVKDGVLKLQGSDNVALCRGFYSYLKNNGMGMFTWSGNNISLPAQLTDEDLTKTVSPFKNHYYFNVCTYGYSMPYWDWTRWEREIDWMALHGINMPLALVGYEAILYRVFRKLGLTNEEINNYFVGPAHLPWMRMGNISGIDGPLNDDWHRSQIALQHKILERMRSLDMKPICPGFSGFIPEALKRVYPQLHIVKTHWGGAFHNWMIFPTEPLFSKISEMFIREWEKEFGKCEYYLVDSFNEMEIPFPEKDNPEQYKMAATYGETVYKGIKAANKDAVWVMQGWMFGYQRHIWDYKTLGALVSRVPDHKMLLLDLAVDYNKHFWHSEVNWEYYKGFYNKLWVYSVIPNMGGKVGMTGVLDFYANGHLEALASPNKGNLIAHGLAPEGIENNEVLYELLTEAGWSDKPTDVRSWLEQYSRNRYGKAPANLMSAWDHLLKSVYGTFTDHPRFNWQLRPGSVKNGTINICDDYFKGLEVFAAASQELAGSAYYRNDLCEMTAHYLGGKIEILTKLIDQEYLLGDTIQAKFLQSRFETLMQGMDILLNQHPTLRLGRWIEFASHYGQTPEQKKQYERNARRIVTIWGPPVDDYAARLWGGLVGNYYLNRWKLYFESRNSGKPANLPEWERQWVEDNHDDAYAANAIDIVSFAHQMIRLSKDISASALKVDNPNMIGSWSIKAGQTANIEFNVPARMLDGLKTFAIETIKGNSPVKILGYELIGDGTTISSSQQAKEAINGKAVYDINIPAAVKANNGCILRIKIQADCNNAAGVVTKNPKI